MMCKQTNKQKPRRKQVFPRSLLHSLTLQVCKLFQVTQLVQTRSSQVYDFRTTQAREDK